MELLAHSATAKRATVAGRSQNHTASAVLRDGPRRERSHERWLYISLLIYNHPRVIYPKNDVVICVISSAIGTAGGEYRRTVAGFTAVFRGLGQALWNREPRRAAV